MALGDLPQPVQAVLAVERPAFLFGSIAPDAQSVSGQPREATHFFNVPFQDAVPACRHLFAAFPALAEPRRLPGAQAAFMAGYVTHLALDELWVKEIFEPNFGSLAQWGLFTERLYLHNALRSHLDASDFKRLTASTSGTLHAARLNGLCPFIADESLLHWRDLIADQFSPGQAIRTVEVFAQRMGADPHRFAALLASPQEMQRRIFDRLPGGALEQFYRDGLALCREMLERYWAGAL